MRSYAQRAQRGDSFEIACYAILKELKKIIPFFSPNRDSEGTMRRLISLNRVPEVIYKEYMRGMVLREEGFVYEYAGNWEELGIINII